MFYKTAQRLLEELNARYNTSEVTNVKDICNYIDTKTEEQIIDGDHYDLMQLAVLKPKKILERKHKLSKLGQVVNTARLVKFLNSPGTFATTAKKADVAALEDYKTLCEVTEGSKIKKRELEKFLAEVSDVMFSIS